MAARTKSPVTMRALLQRINRKLAADGEVIRKTRERWVYDLGTYHRLDMNRNYIIGKEIDPEALARDLGVMAEWEAVVE